MFCLPETKGVPLENMESLFDVWLTETPLVEKLKLQGGSAQARAARKRAEGNGGPDVENGVKERRQ